MEAKHLFSAGIYRQCQEDQKFKFHTIRSGNRWKQGDWASLRVWTGKPYVSKQVEFAKVQIAKEWKFKIKLVDNESLHIFINDVRVSAFHPFDKKLAAIAGNDGLEVMDFHSWFAIHPQKQKEGFNGQILCWDESIEY